MLQVWQLMLTRLQTAKTPKAIRGFIYFTSLFIDKQGAPQAQQSLDAVQPNLFTVLLEQIWLPNLQSMHFRHTAQRVVAVAMTKVRLVTTFCNVAVHRDLCSKCATDLLYSMHAPL